MRMHQGSLLSHLPFNAFSLIMHPLYAEIHPGQKAIRRLRTVPPLKVLAQGAHKISGWVNFAVRGPVHQPPRPRDPKYI